LTRVWNVQGQFGYASNRALTSQPGIQGGDYGSYFVGGGAGRPLGRNLDFSFAYTAQIQKATSTVCSGTGCSDTQTQNIFTVNLQWHTRPFVIE